MRLHASSCGLNSFRRQLLFLRSWTGDSKLDGPSAKESAHIRTGAPALSSKAVYSPFDLIATHSASTYDHNSQTLSSISDTVTRQLVRLDGILPLPDPLPDVLTSRSAGCPCSAPQRRG